MKRNILLPAALIVLFAIPIAAQNSPVPVAGWNVSYALVSTTPVITPRQILFMSFSNGTGTFRIVGPRTTTTTQTTFPAVYDWVTPDFISFSSEVELPVGNCCRETGTLIFKGNRSNTGEISGSVLFVVNMPGTAAPNPYVIRTGTFIATPIPIVTARSDRDR